MKKLHLVIPIFSLVLGLAIWQTSIRVAASTASPTPSPTATDSAIMINAKQRVDMLKQTNSPAVKGVTTQQLIKFGIIGTLDKIVGSTLQIQTPDNSTRLVELDRNAMVLKDQKPIAREDLELNIPVIIMGFKQSDNTLLARRLVLSNDSIFGTKRASLYGKVTANTTKLLTLSGFKDGQSATLNFKLGTKTSFLNTLGSTIKRTDVKLGDPIIAVFADEDNSASASAVHIYSLSAAAIPTPTVIPVPGL